MRARGTRENIAFAVRAIRDHKLRSSLTVLGIVVGVMTVIAMISVLQGFNDMVMGDFMRYGATLVQFQKFDVRFGGGHDLPEEQRNRKNLTLADAAALRRLCPSIAAVSPERYVYGGVSAKAGGQESNSPVLGGAVADYPPANNHFVADGRFFNDSEVLHHARVAVLAPGISDTLFPHKDPLGKTVTISGRQFIVIGLLEKKGSSHFGPGGDNQMFIPITVFDEMFPKIAEEEGLVIATIPKRPEMVPQLIEEGTAVLRVRRHVAPNKPDDFGIRTPDAFISSFKQVSAGVYMAMFFISSIGLVIGGVGVMNIMLVSVKERTREIGIRKALGAMRSDIVLQFLVEAMTLTGVGGLAGIGVGLGIALIAHNLSPIPARTPVWSIAIGWLVSVSVGLFFGIYPAYKAARLDPIESLHYE
jgi:putative ABC transport system permease protein